jgi:hypothetical protein
MRATILFLGRVAALGYQFLVRLSLAAVASLVASTGAVAGALEGAVRVESEKCRAGAERRVSAYFADVLCGCGALSPIMR